MSVVTRIPPSPTGRFHIGTARTALFNYLYARKMGGKFLFRVEDTDRERSLPEYEADIIEGLRWLGLEHDGEMIRQSERAPRHAELLKQLVDEGKAYLSKEESSKNPGTEVEVVRLKNPGKVITFQDEIRGEISFDTTELKDFVIGRAIDDPLYHFAVVVDDSDMGVTHVIRGEDHISNTPRQILIQEALGVERPVYGHLPLILAPDKSKLSKRHGAVSLLEYRNDGFIPAGIVNYLALLGWGPGDDREHFSLAELVDAFDLSHVHKSGAVFDIVKFKSVNQRWLRLMSDEEFVKEGGLSAPDQNRLLKAVPLMKERAHIFNDAREMLEGELSCLFTTPTIDRSALISKEKDEGAGSTTKGHLEALQSQILAYTGPMDVDAIKDALMPYADENGRGEVLWPLRYSLSGLERSPDPFTLISILGKEESLSRIQSALAILGE